MNAGARLAAFGVVLTGALGAGALAGNVVGPLSAGEQQSGGGMDRSMDGGTGHDSAEDEDTEGAEAAQGASEIPGGVLVAQDGYTLDPATTALDPVAPELRFRILGPDGHPVHDFDARHERKLHLIVASTDLRAYRHLHPTLAGDGSWSVDIPTLAPGAYRAIADFAVAGGPELTLGVDLHVAGTATVRPLPEPAATTTVAGYEVTLDGTPTAGTDSELRLSVRRGGRPVTDLAPYFGAFGHLVALRDGDLAYLHVHPLDGAPAAGERGGPEVAFSLHVPSPGDYRLFFDFSHHGTVRTAAFTVHVPAHDEAADGNTAHDDHADTGGHGA